MVSAYKSSPYFEYYEDEIVGIFERKEKFLLDLNFKTLDFINTKLNLNVNLEERTESYQTADENLNFRNRFDAKSKTPIEMPEYMQVFDEKFGFMPDLSILDLLCNEGPKSATYLNMLKN